MHELKPNTCSLHRVLHAHTIILHRRAQLRFIESRSDDTRTAIGKGLFNRIDQKLVDDESELHGIGHGKTVTDGRAFD